MLLHSGILMAQNDFFQLDNYNLKGAIFSVSEKSYIPDEAELTLEESVNREFDEFGRMVKWEAKTEFYGEETSTYYFEGENLKYILKKEDGFQSAHYFNYKDSLLVSAYYCEEELDEIAFDTRDTLIYFKDHYSIQSINNLNEVLSNKDIYKDNHGRDTLHIEYSTNGEKDYERRFSYIQNTDWWVDQVIVDSVIIASSEYEYKVDGTHVFTFNNPTYELYMIREEKYNTEGLLVLSHTEDKGRGTSSYLEYTYNYDETGNWVQRKAVDSKGELFEVVERSIVYFK